MVDKGMSWFPAHLKGKQVKILNGPAAVMVRSFEVFYKMPDLGH